MVVELQKNASIKHRQSLGIKILIGTVLILTLVSATFFPKSTIKAANSGDFLSEEGPPPPGANDPNCRLDEKHPNPVGWSQEP
jgi:hypothetical protein